MSTTFETVTALPIHLTISRCVRFDSEWFVHALTQWRNSAPSEGKSSGLFVWPRKPNEPVRWEMPKMVNTFNDMTLFAPYLQHNDTEKL